MHQYDEHEALWHTYEQDCGESEFEPMRHADRYEEYDPFLTDAEADADSLASAGWGTDEDYNHYDCGEDY